MSDARLAPLQRMDPLANKMFTGVNDLFSPYLGPTPRTHAMDGYERRPADKWNFPEAHRGRNNLYIRDTIEDMMWTADQTWYTSPDGAMPFKLTNELHRTWTNLTANAHLMDVTPYQSTSSLTTQERQVRRAALIRRGIASEFEHDFLKTAMGRVSFLASLRQIANSVLETSHIEILRALVQSHRYQHEWQRKYGIIRDKDLRSYFENDRFRFAIVQKTKNGLEKLDDLINSEVRQSGGRTDAWILHENVSRYAELVRPEKTDYYLAGQRGPDRINGEGDRLLAAAGTTDPLDRIEPRRFVNDVKVYIARNFNVPDLPDLDILHRVRQIGEFNTMIDENTDYSKYSSDSRNIAIYNEDIDDFSKITLEDAIRNCGLWDPVEGSGDVRPLQVDPRRGGHDIRDVKRDFLTYFPGDDTNAGQTVKILGHINPFFLPVSTLLNCAQTLENRLRLEGGNAATQARVLGNILGFNVDPALLGDEVVVPVVSAVGAAAGGQNNSVDEIQQALFQVFTKSAPARKRTEIQEIANMAGSFEDRVRTIQDKFLEYAEEKVPGTKLKKPDAVAKFFAERQSQYEQAVQEAQSAPVASGVQSSTEIVGYRAPGLDLSGEGLQYLYKGSTRKSTGNRTADQSSVLRQLADQIHDLQQAQRSRSGAQRSTGRGVRDTGAGMSLEGISMMAFGDTSGRRDLGRGQIDPVLADLTGRFDALAEHGKNLETSGGSLRLRRLALQLAGLPMNREAMLRLARNNIAVPLNFLLFRPHMQYKTRPGIKLATGGGAGHCWYGTSNAMIQGEVSRKISQIHYTLHMRAVVEEPRNVYVQNDMYCEEYQGGNGIKFYNPATYQVRDFANHNRPSIICVAIPPAERNIPSPMDASGRFYVEYNAGLMTDEEFQELHYTTAFRYNMMYGFYGTARKQGADLPQFSPVSALHNRVMYQGHQWMFNTRTNAFDRVRTNRGHFGKNVYPGCGEVRNGNLKYLREEDYSKFTTI